MLNTIVYRNVIFVRIAQVVWTLLVNHRKKADDRGRAINRQAPAASLGVWRHAVLRRRAECRPTQAGAAAALARAPPTLRPGAAHATQPCHVRAARAISRHQIVRLCLCYGGIVWLGKVFYILP